MPRGTTEPTNAQVPQLVRGDRHTTSSKQGGLGWSVFANDYEVSECRRVAIKR